MANESNSRRLAVLVTLVVLACGARGQNSPPLSATDPVVHKGLFSIDVAVTDKAGNPVPDLAPWDFALFDNGQPTRIRTFAKPGAPSAPSPVLIFVVDAVNLSQNQLAQAENAITNFAQRNGTKLEFPCVLYRLTRDGLFSSLRPLTDPALLIEELAQKRAQVGVWKIDREAKSVGSSAGSSKPNPLSLRALGSIAIDQRDVPGHKVVVWIGPGWPANAGDNGFSEATELSTRLREARITLDNVNVWPNPDISFNYQDYLEAPTSQKDMEPGRMALQVIATHTGGLVLDSSGDFDRDINLCVQQLRSIYTVTFNPPRTDTVDEYHHLAVQVKHPAVTVHAPDGYYNEPVYFDNPRPGIEKVTVAQLEQIVHSQKDLQRKLADIELTERLSTPRLQALSSLIRREQELQALTADADLSIALPPPPDELVNRPPPSPEEQRTILLRTYDYLRSAIPKLPDFYALRTTMRFAEPAGRDSEIWKMPHQDQTLHVAGGEHATVLYRNGHEVVETKQKLGKHPAEPGVRARGLETRGTFGPILSYVWTAAASNPDALLWKRWERTKYGDVAVFSYRAASPNEGPDITYCCLPQGNGETPYQNKADTYGEFAVNPDTGAIMRIAINADLDEDRDPDVPLIRSQIMVEYGPVELGGKTYICPQRSVDVSRGRTQRQLHEWGMVFNIYGYFETMINDSTFSGYHKFGSTFRILPDYEETQ